MRINIYYPLPRYAPRSRNTFTPAVILRHYVLLMESYPCA